MFKKIIWLLLMLFAVLEAAGGDLQEKLAKLQTLPKSERFMLMNQIKKELAQMNAQQRRQALQKLRASMHKGRGRHQGQGLHKHQGIHRQEGRQEPLHRNFEHQPQQREPIHQNVQGSRPQGEQRPQNSGMNNQHGKR